MSAARRRRGPLAAVVVVLVLALVGVGLVVADRRLHAYAEQQVAAQLQTSLGTEAPPDVVIAGTPFLTQLVANRFGQVDVSATGVTSQERHIRLDTLQATLHDVRTADRYRRITAGRLDGTVTLNYDAVSTLAGRTITFAGDDGSGHGRVQTTAGTTIFGRQLDVTLTGVLGVDEAAQSFTVSDPALDLAGIDVPSSLVSTLAGQFLPKLPVGALPLGVRLESVQATATGLVAQVGGTDVVVTG